MPCAAKTPARMALEFRIWQYANARGWDCTSEEIGIALGLSTGAVAGICRAKGWYAKLRMLKEYDFAGNRPAATSVGQMGEAFVEAVAPYRAIAASIQEEN